MSIPKSVFEMLGRSNVVGISVSAKDMCVINEDYGIKIRC